MELRASIRNRGVRFGYVYPGMAGHQIGGRKGESVVQKGKSCQEEQRATLEYMYPESKQRIRAG
jgi:hypothetical protein